MSIVKIAIETTRSLFLNKTFLVAFLTVSVLALTYFQGKKAGSKEEREVCEEAKLALQAEISVAEAKVFEIESQRNDKVSKIYNASTSSELLCLWSQDGWGPKDYPDRKTTCYDGSR